MSDVYCLMLSCVYGDAVWDVTYHVCSMIHVDAALPNSFLVMEWDAGKSFMLWVQAVGKIRMLILE